MAARHGVDEYIVQAPFISDSDIEYALRDIRKRYKPGDDRELGAQQLEPEQKFGREQFLEVVIEQLEGHLSYRRVYELLGPAVATRDALKAMYDEIMSSESIVHRELAYETFRRGNGYYLRPMSDETSEESGDTMGAEHLRMSGYRVAS